MLSVCGPRRGVAEGADEGNAGACSLCDGGLLWNCAIHTKLGSKFWQAGAACLVEHQKRCHAVTSVGIVSIGTRGLRTAA